MTARRHLDDEPASQKARQRANVSTFRRSRAARGLPCCFAMSRLTLRRPTWNNRARSVVVLGALILHAFPGLVSADALLRAGTLLWRADGDALWRSADEGRS